MKELINHTKLSTSSYSGVQGKAIKFPDFSVNLWPKLINLVELFVQSVNKIAVINY